MPLQPQRVEDWVPRCSEIPFYSYYAAQNEREGKTDSVAKFGPIYVQQEEKWPWREQIYTVSMCFTITPVQAGGLTVLLKDLLLSLNPQN